MTGSRRSLVTAILASLAAIGFVFSIFAMVSDANFGINNHEGTVVYTFDQYRCVETAPEQQCEWIGTVTNNGIVEATNVAYREAVGIEVSDGYQVPALWSYRDPLNAWSIEGSRAWLNTLTTTAASLIFLVAMMVASIYWWRRYGREKRAEATSASKKPSSREKEPVSS